MPKCKPSDELVQCADCKRWTYGHITNAAGDRFCTLYCRDRHAGIEIKDMRP